MKHFARSAAFHVRTRIGWFAFYLLPFTFHLARTYIRRFSLFPVPCSLAQRVQRFPLYLLPFTFALTLAACGPEAPAAWQEPLPTSARLPTVTPFSLRQATSAESPTQVEEADVADTAAPTSPPLAEEGPVTASMEALQLGGERFATMGDPSAPITMVEFSDHGCPYCGRYHESVFPTIKEQYIDTGKMYYVYKDYPVVSLNGGLAAQAVECAGEQGRYWEMHDRLFDNPSEWNESEDAAIAAFRSYAEAIDADADALAQCVTEGRYASDVQGDYEEGAALRLRGTPAFFIDGALLSGAQPLEVFVQAIDQRLAAAEGTPEAQ